MHECLGNVKMLDIVDFEAMMDTYGRCAVGLGFFLRFFFFFG